MGKENKALSSIKQNLILALTSPVSDKVREVSLQQLQDPPKHQQIESAIKENESLIYECNITPSKLVGLVDNNGTIAAAIITKLRDSQDVKSYLKELLSMPITVQSMEVINKLVVSIDLPTEFLHMYISNCFTCCENTQQTRLVRLVCVLLQWAIRNKVINVKELSNEITTFCARFSKVKEASTLFRLLVQQPKQSE